MSRRFFTLLVLTGSYFGALAVGVALAVSPPLSSRLMYGVVSLIGIGGAGAGFFQWTGVWRAASLFALGASMIFIVTPKVVMLAPALVNLRVHIGWHTVGGPLLIGLDLVPGLLFLLTTLAPRPSMRRPPLDLGS